MASKFLVIDMRFWQSKKKKIRLQDVLLPPKKGGNNPSLLPLGNAWKSVSLPSTSPKLPEPKGQCECCGNAIYSEIQECELCGKKMCQDCDMIITKTMHNLGWGSSTLMYVPGSTLSFTGSNHSNQKTIPRDIAICISCAEILKLSLRIAASQGVIDKDETQE